MSNSPQAPTIAPQNPTDPSNTPYNDPTASSVNISCLDFLLIELVPMAYRITADLAAREEEWLQSSSSASGPRPRSVEDAGSVAGTLGGGGAGSVVAGGGLGREGTVDEEEAREAVFHRLESLGYRVGLGVVERFSRNTPRPTTPLDIIKFLCKDLWQLLFRKQIDNLKTNHRGIYVLTDNSFKPLGRMSFDTKKYSTNTDGVVNDANGLAKAQPFLYFPAGIIRGCLASLGIVATVTVESASLPGATFQIRTVGAKP
ncbi:trafficking protein particle complex subunit 6B [Dendryphion nanum]|uniref:Trafficking protein particle complex subunit 6B n=1 Tax=Dendryphion nanum TaxID=256645 RepID=A0A9P9DNP8_9PLEO|nr:trafficking protein particle complex subunit 6B [Dendryphion nanum]